MIGTNYRNRCGATYILNLRIVIAVTVDRVGTGDELFCGLSPGVSSSEKPALIATGPAKVTGWRLLERTMIRADNRYDRMCPFIMHLRVIVAIAMYGLRLIDE